MVALCSSCVVYSCVYPASSQPPSCCSTDCTRSSQWLSCCRIAVLSLKDAAASPGTGPLTQPRFSNSTEAACALQGSVWLLESLQLCVRLLPLGPSSGVQSVCAEAAAVEAVPAMLSPTHDFTSASGPWMLWMALCRAYSCRSTHTGRVHQTAAASKGRCTRAMCRLSMLESIAHG
jgi:hypothetical protein